jgi:hypothetical protein
MRFNEVQSYLEQFIGMEVSEAFKADALGALLHDGSRNGISRTNSCGNHIPVKVESDSKFKYKVMLIVDHPNGYHHEDVVDVCRGYRIEKVLNLKELKKYSVKELSNENEQC